MFNLFTTDIRIVNTNYIMLLIVHINTFVSSKHDFSKKWNVENMDFDVYIFATNTSYTTEANFRMFLDFQWNILFLVFCYLSILLHNSEPVYLNLWRRAKILIDGVSSV